MRQSLRRFNKRSKLFKELKRLGWRIEQSKHMKLYCPCGEHLLVTPVSPGDRRGYQNFLSDLNRSGCKELP